MKEIVEWLMHIERKSAKLYREAAAYFNDPTLIQFLWHLADDEAFHYQIMVEASKIIEDYPEVESAFVVDEEVKTPIVSTINRARNRLASKTLTKALLIDTIVAIEYAEWNDIFLYVVNKLKIHHPNFKSIAAEFQRHLRHIEHFLESDDYGRQKVESIRKLRPVWTENILIVEDDPMISNMLATVMGEEGAVDTAENGEIGLEKIRQRYYRLVISDIHMPEMDGITLYKKSVKAYPGIASRYLFFTGNPSPETMTFLNSNDCKFVLKPGTIQELKSQALRILHQFPAN